MSGCGRGSVVSGLSGAASSRGECLRLGLANEVRYSLLPILIGEGIPFFEKLDRDVALHLTEIKAYQSGTVALRYEVRGRRREPSNAVQASAPSR